MKKDNNEDVEEQEEDRQKKKDGVHNADADKADDSDDECYSSSVYLLPMMHL